FAWRWPKLRALPPRRRLHLAPLCGQLMSPPCSNSCSGQAPFLARGFRREAPFRNAAPFHFQRRTQSRRPALPFYREEGMHNRCGLVLAAVIGFSSPAWAQGATPAPTDMLTVAVPFEPQTLDPMASTTDLVALITGSVLEPL